MLSAVSGLVGVGVGVVPYVPVPLGGIEDGVTICALFDLDSWILGTCLNPGAQLGGARDVFWKTVSGAVAGGGHAEDCRRVYHLPSSLTNPRKTIFKSPPICPTLPVRLSPLGEQEEKKLIGAIIESLVLHYGLVLDETPSLDRGMVTPVEKGSDGRIVVVGASHMYKMAEYLPVDSISLAYPGFKPSTESIVVIKEKLDALSLKPGDTVVLDLLSNSAYMGTDVNGLPSPAERADDGRYHIPGSLTMAFCYS
jgi:hypothetical protein